MKKVKFRELEPVILGINELNTCKMNYTLKLSLHEVEKIVAEKSEWFEQEKYNLAGEYGEKDENGEPKIEGGNYVIDKTKREEFNREVLDLLNTEFEVPALDGKALQKYDDISGNGWKRLALISTDLFVTPDKEEGEENATRT